MNKTTNTSLLQSSSDPADDTSVCVTKLECPECASPLYRIHRRFRDRLLSLIVPVQRYRCSAQEDLNCKWEGLVRIQSKHSKKKKHDSLTAKKASEKPQRSKDSITTLSDIRFEDMAQITLDSIGDAVLVVNPQGRVIYLNKVAESMTGWSSEAALGQPVEEVFYIVDGASLERRKSPSQRAMNENRILELALGSVLLRRDGTGIAIEDSAAPIRSYTGETSGAVIVFHDSRQSQLEIQKLNRLAYHDFLTGLPNRVLLMERLTQAIGMAKRQNKQVALLFLDLDHFKHINDSFGHVVGDRFLQEVAADIVACVRSTDTVSRHGGDEFIILLTQIEQFQDSSQVAEKLLTKFEKPRIIDGHKLQATLSIGISVYPEDGLDGETLMKNADSAMYSAKMNGRNAYQFCHGRWSSLRELTPFSRTLKQ